MKGLENHKNLGIGLVFGGVVLDILGAFFLPPGTTTQCSNQLCVTTVPPSAAYFIAVTGVAILLSGFVLIYLAVRPRFKTMFP